MEEQANGYHSDIDGFESSDSEDTISWNGSRDLDEPSVICYADSINAFNSNAAEKILSITPPNHNWFGVNEIVNRQIGVESYSRYPGSFQRRFCGSLYSVQRLKVTHQLRDHNFPVRSLSFNRTGTLLSSLSQDGNVVIWDWNKKKRLQKYHSGHVSKVYHSVFIDLIGEPHIATCGADGQVRVANLSLNEGVKSNILLETRPDVCFKLAGLNDQPHVLLSVGTEGSVLRHDIRENGSGKLLQFGAPLFTIQGNPNRTMEFCIGGGSDVVNTYDQRKTDSPLATFFPSQFSTQSDCSFHVTRAIYNHNGTEILASYYDDEIYLFDVNSKPGTFLKKYSGRQNSLMFLVDINFFGPNSEFVVSGSSSGHVYFWEKDSTAIVQWIQTDYSRLTTAISIEPHPHLPIICSGGCDTNINILTPISYSPLDMEGLKQILIKRENDRCVAHWCESCWIRNYI